ncbi:fibronectin type III domain-containing protein [Aquiluna sp. Uisw_065]|uniref:fibronectin type III domain-containing protein n=1 Tax=Aquiluna sp. Uisw_065 TaxID=3230967 RepID=UPI0039EC7B4E
MRIVGSFRFLAALAGMLLVANVASPAIAAPSAPTNVSVLSTTQDGAATSAGTASVTWTQALGAATYSVTATANGQTSQSGSVAVCAGGSCSSSLAGLTGGITYSVVVTSIAADGSETPSAAPNATIIAETVPFTPGSLTLSLSSGQITLGWTAPSNGGSAIIKYVISDGGSFSVDVSSASVAYSSSSFTAGQNYTFSIVAVNSLGEAASDDFDAITFATAPTAPAAPTATVEGSSIPVNWLAPATNGSAITSYSVFLINSSGTDVGTPAVPSPATSTSLTLSNVASGTYTLKVTATNAQGTSARSIASTSKIISSGASDNTPTFSPADLASMDIGTNVILKASAPSGGAVTITVSASPAGACTYSAGKVFAVSAGTCNVAAAAAATASFAAGTGSKTITVKAAQSITFSPVASQALPGPIAVSAGSSSGLSVRFTVIGSCSISGSVVSFSAIGSCSVTAAQPGNVAYSPAQSITHTFQIASTSSAVGPGSSGSVGPGSSGSIGGSNPTAPGSGGDPVTGTPSTSAGAKVNAGSFKGYIALYAKGHKGKRFSAKVGKDWVIVPALKSDFVRIVEYTGVGYKIAVRVYIDRKLLSTIPILTK